MAKNFAQGLAAAFLAVLVLGFCAGPLAAQVFEMESGIPPPPVSTPAASKTLPPSDRSKVSAQDSPVYSQVDVTDVPTATPAEGEQSTDSSPQTAEAEPRVSSEPTSESFPAEASVASVSEISPGTTAFAVGYPTPSAERSTTIMTEEGKPLEVKIVPSKNGGSTIQYKYRDRVVKKEVPVGLSVQQARAIFAQGLKEAKIADRDAIYELRRWADNQFSQINKQLDRIEKKVGGVERVVREQGQQTRDGLVILFCCLVAAMFIVAATAITALRR